MFGLAGVTTICSILGLIFYSLDGCYFTYNGWSDIVDDPCWRRGAGTVIKTKNEITRNLTLN